MRILASTVLTAEALVVFFACLVAVQLTDIGTATVWAVGGSFALLCLLLCGLLRHRWALWVGSAFQVVLIASGIVIPMMYAIGVFFAMIWIAALRVGAKVDAIKAARAAATVAGTAAAPTGSSE
jgi:Protein of unknown function (DUF4233)